MKCSFLDVLGSGLILICTTNFDNRSYAGMAGGARLVERCPTCKFITDGSAASQAMTLSRI
jgi:hypothetical protein